MRYLLLSVLVVCVIGIMIPSAFAQNQIPIEIFSKGSYTLDQVISFTIKVDRYLPNTPFEVYICTVGGQTCKGLPEQNFIGGDIFGGKINRGEHLLSTDIDSALKKTGTVHFRLPMSNCDKGIGIAAVDRSSVASGMGATTSGGAVEPFRCSPSGDFYEIRVYYGPVDDPVGYEKMLFSYSNNLSDEGKKLAKFLVLSKWDIGTSFNFDKPIWGLTPEDLEFEHSRAGGFKTPRVLLKSEQPEISVSKDYGWQDGSLDVFIMQFENEIKAKRYHQEISKYAPAGKGFFYNTGGSEFNLHGFSCIRNDRIANEADIQAGGSRFDVQSYSCVRNNLGVYIEGSSSAATAAYEPVLEKINESDYFQQLEVSAPASAAEQTQQSKGGGCLIATAAFGSEMAPQVQFLREIRDNTILQTESGTSFMTGFNQFYYSFSPAVADYERENLVFKETVKIMLTPLLTSLTLLHYADIDSESEMLGYGIGVILLNIGMYFVAPAVLIMMIGKRI